MAGASVRLDGRELEKLRQQLQKAAADEDAFLRSCAKELAARLLRKAIRRTPVGVYDKPVSFTTSAGEEVSFTPNTGKNGGTLRRGWTSKTHEEAVEGNGKGAIEAVKPYVDTLKINHSGNNFEIEIVNPVKYASYVEYGHRTRDHTGWVDGQFMLTISEEEVRKSAPQILEKKLEKWLKGCFQ